MPNGMRWFFVRAIFHFARQRPPNKVGISSERLTGSLGDAINAKSFWRESEGNLCMSQQTLLKRISAGVLEVAYYETGPADGVSTILLHGFPYDAHAYDAVVANLAGAGHRCIVPFLRGYGPTRSLSPNTPRSGEQAALGADLLSLMDGLGIERAILGGYDWGGRAACIVSALWPERVIGLVSAGTGDNIQDIAGAAKPGAPDQEARDWYQYYFHTDRGRKGLEEKRAEISRFLWTTWSPSWHFDEGTIRANRGLF